MQGKKHAIAIISETFPPDLCGVADYVNLLAQALSSTYDVHLITRAYNGRKTYRLGAVTIHEVMMSKLYLLDVIKCLRQIKPALIELQLAYSLAANWLNKFNLFSSFTGILIRLLLKAKLVCTVHELTTFLDDGRTSLLRRLYRNLRDYLSTRLFDYYFCVDRTYLRYFKHDHKLFLPSFSNIPSLVEKTAAGTYNFLFFGTIAPHKKIDGLVNLFGELLTLEPQSKLFIVGGLTDGYDEATLQRLLAPLPTDSVHYCGRLSITDLETVLTTCSYALFPFPVTDKNASVLAMMVNGLVVIAETHVETIFETYGNTFYKTSCLTATLIHQVVQRTIGQSLTYKTHQELLEHHIQTRIQVYESLIG